MGKYKYLLKNMGLLTLSSLATRLLSFFLVPLYTSVLSTGEYGTYDLFSTTISLLIPILTVDIQEAVLRFALDEEKPQKVLDTGIKYFWGSIIIVGIFTLVNYFFSFIGLFKQYAVEFFFLYFFTSLSGIISYYVRGADKVKELSVSSVLSSAVTIFLNIYFLLIAKIGLLGYFLSTIIGSAVQCIFLISKLHLWSDVFLPKSHREMQQNMVKYSSPMVANAISWWVNNASDRYVVTWIDGIAANGIYSVSYKIPSIISVLQNIFGQAWTLSAVKDFDRNDSSGFFINVYNLYNFMLVASCSFLIFLNKPLAKFLFAKDFYQAWRYSPFLMISTVFSGMAAFIGGLFSALKKSKSFAQTSVITAIVNTIGNIILVLLIGPLGAAISTAISYMMMWWLRLKIIKNDIDLRVNMKRDILSYLILFAQAIILLFNHVETLFVWNQFFMFLVVLLLYKTEFKLIIRKVFSR